MWKSLIFNKKEGEKQFREVIWGQELTAIGTLFLIFNLPLYNI